MSNSDGYNIHPNLERAMVALCCNEPTTYGRLGAHIDPELLSSEQAKLLMKAVKAVARDHGVGPTDYMVVIQRLYRWKDEGKVTLSSIDDSVEYLIGAPDVDASELVDEVSPIIKRREHAQLVRDVMNTYGARGDFTNIVEKIQRTESIGRVDDSVGTWFGGGALTAIRSIRHLRRLPTGISEIDSFLGGGMPQSAVGLIIGSTGEGKSMFLSHVAANSAYLGLNVAYATLELSRSEVWCRMVANLTGIPIDSLKDGGDGTIDRLVESRVQQLMPKVGQIVVKEFEAHVTEYNDVERWVSRVRHELKARHTDLNVLCVDYVDRIKGAGDYRTAGEIMDAYRHHLAVKHDLWSFTASAAKAKEKGRKRKTEESAADSQHKSRISDVVITLNREEDEEFDEVGSDSPDITYFIGKHRQGKARKSIGPVPTEWEVGRMAPVYREEGW